MAKVANRKSFPSAQQQSILPYRMRGPLLSRGELAFFRVLRAALGGRFLIAIKVRVADLLDCPREAWEEGFGYMVARHHVDIVLCDHATTAVVAAIELDDRSHDRPARQNRDEFLDAAFAAAKVPLIRFTAAARYWRLDVRERIAQAIGHFECDCNPPTDSETRALESKHAHEAPRNRANKGGWRRARKGARGKRFSARLRRPIIAGAKGLPASRGEPRR
jgi:hypothetical protein